MKSISTFQRVLTAIFAALICLATMAVQVPIPATGGYANLGDGVILICAFLLHPLHAVLAAGLGSMLADLLAGYIAYAPGTLLIKAGVALIAALLFDRLGRNRPLRIALPVMIVSGVLAEIFMILAYFAYEAVILGVGLGATGGIPGNVGQGGVGVLLSCIITPALSRSAVIKRLTDDLHS